MEDVHEILFASEHFDVFYFRYISKDGVEWMKTVAEVWAVAPKKVKDFLKRTESLRITSKVEALLESIEKGRRIWCSLCEDLHVKTDFSRVQQQNENDATRVCIRKTSAGERAETNPHAMGDFLDERDDPGFKKFAANIHKFGMGGYGSDEEEYAATRHHSLTKLGQNPAWAHKSTTQPQKRKTTQTRKMSTATVDVVEMEPTLMSTPAPEPVTSPTESEAEVEKVESKSEETTTTTIKEVVADTKEGDDSDGSESEASDSDEEEESEEDDASEEEEEEEEKPKGRKRSASKSKGKGKAPAKAKGVKGKAAKGKGKGKRTKA